MPVNSPSFSLGRQFDLSIKRCQAIVLRQLSYILPQQEPQFRIERSTDPPQDRKSQSTPSAGLISSRRQQCGCAVMTQPCTAHWVLVKVKCWGCFLVAGASSRSRYGSGASSCFQLLRLEAPATTYFQPHWSMSQARSIKNFVTVPSKKWCAMNSARISDLELDGALQRCRNHLASMAVSFTKFG